MTNLRISTGMKRPLTYLLIVVLTVVCLALAVIVLPPGIDWRLTYRPSALALLAGRSPYSADVAPTAPFFAAPWCLIPLLPLALLPEAVGRSILVLVTIAAFAYSAWRMGARLPVLIAFLLSPPVVHCVRNSNIEWMPVLGFVLPPQWGLFLVVIKPQVGVAVVVFWLVEAWRKGKVREVVRVFGPVSLAFAISFALFGFWPSRLSASLGLAQAFNTSLWPASIPVGLALLVTSIKTRKINYAMAASPCLSPYVLLHAWAGALVSIATLNAEMIVVVISMWALVIRW
jgi:hypothetical protein